MNQRKVRKDRFSKILGVWWMLLAFIYCIQMPTYINIVGYCTRQNVGAFNAWDCICSVF